MPIPEVRRIVRDIDLALARSFASDLASLKQTYAAALVRHLIGEIEYLRAELAKAKSLAPVDCLTCEAQVSFSEGVFELSPPKHGGESDGAAVV